MSTDPLTRPFPRVVAIAVVYASLHPAVRDLIREMSPGIILVETDLPKSDRTDIWRRLRCALTR